jgi:hypothetical protein
MYSSAPRGLATVPALDTVDVRLQLSQLFLKISLFDGDCSHLHDASLENRKTKHVAATDFFLIEGSCRGQKAIGGNVL